MNAICFNGSESTGSVGKRIGNNTIKQQETRLLDEPIKDTVAFKGSEQEEKKSSLLTKSLIATGLIALAIGGLGYAHKADLVGKLKDGKVKDFLKKSDCVTEKCHDWCSKIKNFFKKS